VTVECAGDSTQCRRSTCSNSSRSTATSDSVIEYVHSAPVYRSGRAAPVVSLASVLPGRRTRFRPLPGSQVIAVVQADQQRFGLLVDRVLNTEEIVVKPSRAAEVDRRHAGATLLGDGHVALILDVQALSRRRSSARSIPSMSSVLDEEASPWRIEQVLLVGIGGGRRVAMPLASVGRLEPCDWTSRARRGPRGRPVPRDDPAACAAGPGARSIERLRSFGADGLESQASDELLLVVYSEAGAVSAWSSRRFTTSSTTSASQHSDIEDSGLVARRCWGSTYRAARRAIRGARCRPAFYDMRATGRAGQQV